MIFPVKRWLFSRCFRDVSSLAVCEFCVETGRSNMYSICYIYIYYDFIVSYIMYLCIYVFMFLYDTQIMIYIYILRGMSLSFPWHSVFVTPNFFWCVTFFWGVIIPISHSKSHPRQSDSQQNQHDSNNPNETNIKRNFASPSLEPKNIQKSTHAMRLFFGVKKFLSCGRWAMKKSPWLVV